MNDLHDNWEDWLQHIAASINTSVNVSTGKSPYYILYGMEKRLPYDLRARPHGPLYNYDRYAQQQLHTFAKIHSEVRGILKATKAEMMANQHKKAVPVALKEGDTVMLKQGERNSKLGAKFVGPYRVIRNVRGNKFEILDPNTRVSLIIHSDRLKVIPSALNLATEEGTSESNGPQDKSLSHTYNSRPRL